MIEAADLGLNYADGYDTVTVDGLGYLNKTSSERLTSSHDTNRSESTHTLTEPHPGRTGSRTW